jgi:hypothetical protein
MTRGSQQRRTDRISRFLFCPETRNSGQTGDRWITLFLSFTLCPRNSDRQTVAVLSKTIKSKSFGELYYIPAVLSIANLAQLSRLEMLRSCSVWVIFFLPSTARPAQRPLATDH